MEALEIRNLTFSYPEQQIKAIDDFSLTVNEGEFIVLCGPSGCGKSTLLRQFKTVLAPRGKKTGEILFFGRELCNVQSREQAEKIGFVQQSPDNQIVTDKVWHELAFGLESLGTDTQTIRKRTAETASFFGLQNMFYKKTSELSGGQKQLLNLAAVMVMNPSVIILDEPTSQLDPIAASDFLAALGKINRELGVTVIMSEHRLEEAIPLSSRVAVMEKGKLLICDAPAKVGEYLKKTNHGMFSAMPAAMRIWAAVDSEEPCPVTVTQGRDFLNSIAKQVDLKLEPLQANPAPAGEIMLKAEDIRFKYDKNSPDIVKGFSLELKKGSLFALLGGNGTGKTTMLKLLAGLEKPYSGQIERNGTVGMLPQNPQTLFVKKTVGEDLFELFSDSGVSKEEQSKRVSYAVSVCRIEHLLERHPYDLSGGEQQRAALAKILLRDPDIILMDEPTKGLDAEFKQGFAEIIQDLLNQGKAILMVSHDIEFCAEYADICGMFFDGNIVCLAPAKEFFIGNSFYTTAANRISRGIVPNAVTSNDVILALGGKVQKNNELPPQCVLPPEKPLKQNNAKHGKLPWWRKMLAVISAVMAAAVFLNAMRITDLTELIGGGVLSESAKNSLLQCGLFIVSLLVLAFSTGRRSVNNAEVQTPVEKRKLKKRTAVAAFMILALIPLTLFIGVYYFGNMKYYFTSLLVLLECMIPFFLVFEGRKPQARELIIIAVLCAIGVAGRAAFFMLPQFKPVMAITIISGVAFGGETGFLVGAMTMLASNVMFSQGPFTPWQMFAMGIVGFLAGVLFRKGLLKRSRLSLCIFGVLAAVIIYGVIMNTSSALTAQRILNIPILLSYYISGFPFDCVHAAATFIFLWFGAEPMLEKLDRIKVKYGLVE